MPPCTLRRTIEIQQMQFTISASVVSRGKRGMPYIPLHFDSSMQGARRHKEFPGIQVTHAKLQLL